MSQGGTWEGERGGEERIWKVRGELAVLASIIILSMVKIGNV